MKELAKLVLKGDTTLSLTTFSIMTLSIMTFSITTLGITTLIITAFGTQYCCAECQLSSVSFVLSVTNNPIMPSVVMLSVIMLSVVAPFKNLMIIL